MIRVTKGLNVPLSGAPRQEITDTLPVKQIAVVGPDYVGMKPTMAVKAGDKVKSGDLLFTDKKNPSVCYTAPLAGTVLEVNRGEKRVFQSVVIETAGDEAKSFENYQDKALEDYSSEEVKNLLLEAGEWNALRTRPFSKVPSPESKPSSIFVTVTDTHPLAADPEVIVADQKDHFVQGLRAVSKLTDGIVYLCTKSGSKIPGRTLPNIRLEEFQGPHPAGNVGTHIHHLDPVSASKTVWHINYQDVIAWGGLFSTGKRYADRVIALAGPLVKEPRLVRTKTGANLEEICQGQLKEGTPRIISGSVLGGRSSQPKVNFLSRYHNLVSVILEDQSREFLGWQGPGFNKYTVTNCYAGKFKQKLFSFTSNRSGSLRSMVPIGLYEKVIAIDTVPTFLLRSLMTGDTDAAQNLGALELDEEDISLATFVCPCKIEYGPLLRQSLATIEKEG